MTEPGANPGAAVAAQDIAKAAVAVAAFTAMHCGWVRSDLLLAAYVVFAFFAPPRVAWRPMRALFVLGFYVPFAVVWLALVVLYLRGMHAIGLPVPPQPMLQQIADGKLAGWQAAATIVAITAIAPVFEEHVFRGYLWTGLRARLPAVAAHVATAGIFGAFHGWQYALPIGVLGLFFGWLRARQRALLPSICAHAVHNGVTVALALFWPGLLDQLYPR